MASSLRRTLVQNTSIQPFQFKPPLVYNINSKINPKLFIFISYES
jgi:hypothetical protein